MNAVHFCYLLPSKFSLLPDITLLQWMKLQIAQELVSQFCISTFHLS
jgi:hypothetical protein